MTCEECGNTVHTGSHCPKLEEDIMCTTSITTTIIVLNRIKDGTNRSPTTQVSIQVTSKVITKVIMLSIISINHP